MQRLSFNDDFAGRVNFAAKVIARNGTTTRNFDSCFENDDGDAVCAALYRRSLKNPKLAASLWRYLCRESVMPAIEQLKALSPRKLAAEAKRMRDESRAAWESRVRCDECGRPFDDAGDLEAHRVIAHETSDYGTLTGRAPEVSETGPKGAGGGEAVAVDSSTGDTGEGARPEACEVCGREFEEAADLEAHRVIAHELKQPSGRSACPNCERTINADGTHNPEGGNEHDPLWQLFECGRGCRWSQVQEYKRDGEVCSFSGCAPDHTIRLVKTTCSRTEAHNWFRRMPPDTPPTGTDGGGTNGPEEAAEEGGAAAHASERESLPAGEQAALYASADTLKALKVIKDAENVREARDNPSLAAGDKRLAIIRAGLRVAVLNIDRLAKWVSLLSDPDAPVAVTFKTEDGSTNEGEFSVALESGPSYIKFLPQHGIPFACSHVVLTVSDSGELLAPALPDKSSMKAARADLAQTRKVERLRKEAVKVHREAASARADLKRERERYAAAQKVMTSTTYAEALNLSVGVRDARRELRRLQSVIGKVETTYGTQRHRHGGSRRNANYTILSEPQESALDAFAWATEEQRARYADLFKAYTRKRSADASAQAVMQLSEYAVRAFHSYLSEMFGEEFASAVKYHRRALPFRAARKVVTAYPAKRAELELIYQEAEDAYLDAFDAYERACRVARAA